MRNFHKTAGKLPEKYWGTSTKLPVNFQKSIRSLAEVCTKFGRSLLEVYDLQRKKQWYCREITTLKLPLSYLKLLPKLLVSTRKFPRSFLETSWPPMRFGATNFHKSAGKVPVTNRKFPGNFLETSGFHHRKKPPKFNL